MSCLDIGDSTLVLRYDRSLFDVSALNADHCRGIVVFNHLVKRSFVSGPSVVQLFSLVSPLCNDGTCVQTSTAL